MIQNNKSFSAEWIERWADFGMPQIERLEKRIIDLQNKLIAHKTALDLITEIL